MNAAERFVYDLTKRFPALKMALRDLYQGCFDLLPEKESWGSADVTVREGAFYGFHDHCPFSPDGRMLLAHKASIPLRMPRPGESVEIGYFTGENWMEWVPVGTSSAWNWHQGAKLQWRGNGVGVGVDVGEVAGESEGVGVGIGAVVDKIEGVDVDAVSENGESTGTEFLYNDVRDGLCRAVLKDINSSNPKENVLSVPLSSISGDGRYGVGYSFSRVERAMPGYGYALTNHHVAGLPHNDPLDQPVTDRSYLYVTDLNSDKTTPLFSIRELASVESEPDMDGAYHLVSHALFSPSGRRFLFLHRWVKGDLRSRRSRLMTLDVEGRQLHVFPTEGMVSHMAWRGDRQILAWCRVDGRDGYVLFDDLSERSDGFLRIGEGALTSDGHPSFLMDGGGFGPDVETDGFGDSTRTNTRVPSRILTDTYPDRTRRSSLLLFDMNKGEKVLLGQFRHPKRFASADPAKNWRCDLHPRPDRSGKVVCFDSVHTGVRSLCTMPLEIVG